jgi:hypothetical protein
VLFWWREMFHVKHTLAGVQRFPNASVGTDGRPPLRRAGRPKRPFRLRVWLRMAFPARLTPSWPRDPKPVRVLMAKAPGPRTGLGPPRGTRGVNRAGNSGETVLLTRDYLLAARTTTALQPSITAFHLKHRSKEEPCSQKR